MNNDRTPPRIHGRRWRDFDFRPVQPRRVGEPSKFSEPSAVVPSKPSKPSKPVQAKPAPAVVRPSVAPTPKPAVPHVRKPSPVKPVIKAPAKPVVKKPTQTDYRSGTIDDVLMKITTIEAEGSESSQTIIATPNPIMPVSTLKQAKKLKKKRGVSAGITISVLVGVVILGIAGYVAYDTWKTNSVVDEKVSQSVAAPTSGASVLGEGEDESVVAASAVDSYSVAADMPRVLSIDKLGVRARVLPMSVNATGAIQAPVNIFDSGWYTGSAKPGTAGAGLIDGHASGSTRQGLFAYLDTLKKGDTLSVERGDKEVMKYSVVHVETLALDKIDMNELLKPYEGVSEGLNLITCTGTWVADKSTYDRRVLVYTERV